MYRSSRCQHRQRTKKLSDVGEQGKSRRNRRLNWAQGHFLSDSCDKRGDGGKDENTELNDKEAYQRPFNLGTLEGETAA